MKVIALFVLLLSLQHPHSAGAVTKTRRLQGDVCVTYTEVESSNLIENFGGDAVFISGDGNVVVTGDPVAVLDYSTESKSWNERAADKLNSPYPVIGEAHSLSADGNFFAATFNSTLNSTSGDPVIRVVQYSGEQSNDWHEVGGTIRAGSASELELSEDGTILAVSSDNIVQVYKWVVADRTWVQLGGDILGSQAGLENLALSGDGSRVAFVGATATVHVYEYAVDENKWMQLGQNITKGPDFGHAVAFSGDGHFLAISEANYEAKSGPGLVQVYQMLPNNLLWEPWGPAVEGDSGSDDNAGSSVAISEDGFVLVVGANGNSGRVRIYTFDDDNEVAGGVWQLQETLQVPLSGERSRFGSAVALTPDGSYLAANTIFDGASVHVFALNYDCPTSAPSASPTSRIGAPSPAPSPQFDAAPSNSENRTVPEGKDSSSAGVWIGVVLALVIAITGFGGWKWYNKRHLQPPKQGNQEDGEAGATSDSGLFEPVHSVIASFLQTSSSGHSSQTNPAPIEAQAEAQVYLPNLPTTKDQCRSVARPPGEVPTATAIPAYISVEPAMVDVHAVHKNRGFDP